MTVNTQPLRELLAGLPLVKWSKTGSTVEIPETEDFAGKQLPITGLDKQYARRLAAFIAAANPATVTALLDEIDRLRARLEFEPAAPEWDGIACRDETIRVLEREIDALKHDIGEYVKISSELATEIDALRAELQARQWQPIETCPRKHGKHYLICKDCGPGSLPSISIGFCFDDQKDWHLMESNCTAEMLGYRVTHWHPLPLPPAPPQGDGA